MVVVELQSTYSCNSAPQTQQTIYIQNHKRKNNRIANSCLAIPKSQTIPKYLGSLFHTPACRFASSEGSGSTLRMRERHCARNPCHSWCTERCQQECLESPG